MTWLHWLGIGLNVALLTGIVLEFKDLLKKEFNVRHPHDTLYPGQDPETSGPWTLYRDGVEILSGSERECWQYIHSHHSFSVDHACRYEGYSIKPTQKES